MTMHDRKLGLAARMIPRSQVRIVDQRCEERLEGVVSTAIIEFRGEEHIVPVHNISSRGTMVEAAFAPRIGENVGIRFDQCTRMSAFVRWVRDGQIGLNFGHEIVLG